jgi:hypothetical protein
LNLFFVQSLLTNLFTELQRSEGCPEVVPSLMLPKSRQPNSTSTNTLGGRHGFNGGDSDSELDK